MGVMEDMATILSSHGCTLGTDLFINWLPETPDACVSLTQTGGPEPRFTMTTGVAITRPMFQLRVRGAKTGAQAAMERIETLWAAFTEVNDLTLNGHRYLTVQAQQSPFYMGRDATERPSYVANFLVEMA